MELKHSRTSADYSRIEVLGLNLVESATQQRVSAMLDYAMLDKIWRELELGCRVHGYDIFAAWDDICVRARQARMQLQWLSARHLDVAGQDDPLVVVALRDAAELREKNAAYGESWKRRGGIGAFMMLARKWDRIDNILAPLGGGQALDLALQRNPGDVLDDIGDLRRYLLLVEDEALRLGDLPHYGHDERPMLLLAYVNHNHQPHSYLVKPRALVFGSEHYPRDWCLQAEVEQRDGVDRPGTRHFALRKLNVVPG
jgi:hypothetical protein